MQREEVMKGTLSKYITAVAVVAVPIVLNAQVQLSNQPARYAVQDLGTLGGTSSVAQGINKRGWVVGNSTLSGDTVTNAFLQHHAVMTSLGTLGGANSNAVTVAERGQTVGFAESSIPDPMGENFCYFFTGSTCLPFLWQDGAMAALPLLGGTNGAAFTVNNEGQIGGVAETSTLDSTCPSPEFNSQPVLWVKGVIQSLPTFPGDPDGFVNSINNKGQAVGGSGSCWNVFPAVSIHALLWQNGNATNLGTLGGTLFSEAYAINERGQIAGASEMSGDTSPYAPFGGHIHAFFWEKGVMKDLGALPGDTASFAVSLNNGGQAVGVGSRAIIWRDGVAIDLNSLVPGPPFSPLYLLYASAINDRGEIAGQGLASNGELHAFLAVPCDEEHLDAAPCNDDEIGAEVVAAATLDGTVNASAPRKSVAMLAGRFGGKSGLAQIPQISGRRVPAFGSSARNPEKQR
jgi:probable HAF family extracellular repeat protein